MIERLLVPLDGSPLAECTLPHAVAIARAFGAQITLLRVLEREKPRSVDLLEWHIRKAEVSTYLDGVAGRLRALGLQVEKEIREGPAAESIVEFAHEQRIDLILLSSHGRSGLSGWNISSVVQKIILWACMPTMIVRAYQAIPASLADLRYRCILVPLDGSPRAECALPLATTLARHQQAQLLLAHVVCRPEMPRRAPPTREDVELAEKLMRRNLLEASRYLEQLRQHLAPDTQTCLLQEDSAALALQELVRQREADLVVLSAHGYSGSNKWPYGSVALNFIAYGTTPLLIVQDLSPGELERTQAEMAAMEYKGH